MTALYRDLIEEREAVSADDVDVLARTVYGEARGESVRGQEAVAAVVMNRMRRARERGGYWWGSSVAEVCLKPWQFSAWNPSDPNREKLLSVDREDPRFQMARRIARRALTGHLIDPTNGATHYHANGTEPLWSVGREPSAVVGNHRFYNDVE